MRPDRTSSAQFVTHCSISLSTRDLYFYALQPRGAQLERLVLLAASQVLCAAARFAGVSAGITRTHHATRCALQMLSFSHPVECCITRHRKPLACCKPAA